MRVGQHRLGGFRLLLRQLDVVGVAEGLHKHLHSLGQCLDVPGEDLRLCWPTLRPSTSSAPWCSGALRARLSRVVELLYLLVGVLVHGLLSERE